jgi:GTPase
VEEANVIVLVVDGQGGSTGADEEVVIWLRRVHPNKPVVLAVNKCESPAKAFLQAAEFWTLGAGEPVPVSAISGSGSGELLDRMVAMLPPQAALTGDAGANDGLVSVAIVGRPNVGKSSLLNAIVGKERSIVSPIAGTTRDAIDTDVVDAEGRAFKLIDTAGVRKRTAVASSKDGAEPLSVERAFRALRRAEVAVLVIDATEGITQQDYRLSEAIAAEGRACVIVVNKWDLVPKKTDTTIIDFEANVRAELRMVEWANVVFTSAKTGQRVKKVLDAVTASAEEHRRRISTATLNMVLQEAAAWRAPPSTGLGKRGKVYYGTQAAIKPPTFVLFVNDPNLFSEDYRKYVERQLRENVGFPGTPLRVYWRGKPGNNRYAGTGLK